ncbi:MAG: hypothetical protein ACTHZW_10825 [Microbacteriaceae bacterium]|jgi:DNA anti-recombination protein RmuC|uniref:Uncharacterized protein n=2 Tax=Actinomycetes TaxID=1760 RepID=A0A2H1K9V7_9MICO|nr:hypothetical protein [Brevibacterium sp.]SMX96500.1 hypothetical protein BANT918_02226 [Brevibacterium antiquum CNRZ 918]
MGIYEDMSNERIEQQQASTSPAHDSNSQRLRQVEEQVAEQGVALKETVQTLTRLRLNGNGASADAEVVERLAASLEALRTEGATEVARSEAFANQLVADLRGRTSVTLDSSEVARIVGDDVAEAVAEAVKPRIEALRAEMERTATSIREVMASNLKAIDKRMTRAEAVQERVVGMRAVLTHAGAAVLPFALVAFVAVIGVLCGFAAVPTVTGAEGFGRVAVIGGWIVALGLFVGVVILGGAKLAQKFREWSR